jgi:hypothetical protein
MELNKYNWKLISVSQDQNHANFAKLDGEYVLVETMHRYGKPYQRKLTQTEFKILFAENEL